MTASEQIRLELVKAILQAEATAGPRAFVSVAAAESYNSGDAMRRRVDALEAIVTKRSVAANLGYDPQPEPLPQIRDGEPSRPM